MTLAQFFGLLRVAHREHPEYTVVFVNDKQLRLKGPDGIFCPLTFVYFHKHEQVADAGEADWVGINLGLSPEAVEDIILSSDSWNEFDYEGLTQRRLASILNVM